MLLSFNKWLISFTLTFPEKSWACVVIWNESEFFSVILWTTEPVVCLMTTTTLCFMCMSVFFCVSTSCVYVCVGVCVCACMCMSLMKNTSGVVWSCAACPGEEAGVSGAGSCDLAGQACNQTHELDEREQEEGVALGVNAAVKTDQILPAPLISITQHAIN